MTAMIRVIEDYFMGPDDSIHREVLVEKLHKKFPGTYTVNFKDSPKLTLSITFTDPEEATLFRIKGWM